MANLTGNWQRRKWVLTTGLNWVKLCWESSSMLLAIGILHFHCISHLPTVRPSAWLPGCLTVPVPVYLCTCVPVPVPVPVSGRIIRWLSAFALIYEERATSDHSISSTLGNTGGTREREPGSVRWSGSGYAASASAVFAFCLSVRLSAG